MKINESKKSVRRSIDARLQIWFVNMKMGNTINYPKVLNSIVKPFFVYVMDFFISFKQSTQVFLHYKTMFLNVAVDIAIRVGRYITHTITKGIYKRSALPIRIAPSLMPNKTTSIGAKSIRSVGSFEYKYLIASLTDFGRFILHG